MCRWVSRSVTSVVMQLHNKWWNLLQTAIKVEKNTFYVSKTNCNLFASSAVGVMRFSWGRVNIVVRLAFSIYKGDECLPTLYFDSKWNEEISTSKSQNLFFKSKPETIYSFFSLNFRTFPSKCLSHLIWCIHGKKRALKMFQL